jgi:hypothetical protein
MLGLFEAKTAESRNQMTPVKFLVSRSWNPHPWCYFNCMIMKCLSRSWVGGLGCQPLIRSPERISWLWYSHWKSWKGGCRRPSSLLLSDLLPRSLVVWCTCSSGSALWWGSQLCWWHWVYSGHNLTASFSYVTETREEKMERARGSKTAKSLFEQV